MANLTLLALTYVVGGLTFLPLAALIVFIHGYVFLPRSPRRNHQSHPNVSSSDDASPEVDQKLLDRSQEPDVAAGYFAVCREYVPGGVNGKPPERTTPAGETIAAESPSVYQSMYRTIFERNKTQGPSIEGGKPVKKARNVFYVVLRHGHLLLFDNSDQLEVRHVIALAYYDLDLYAGGDVIPEGELFIKRNCIRLKKKKATIEETSRSMPFYLFSDNCSEKEDFYHALIHSLVGSSDRPDDLPTTMIFETEDMIKLVRALHVSDENQHTRWLNAIIGRLFLAIYKTDDIENLLRTKIEKKIARVPKPRFLTSLTLESVHMGNSAPAVANPKLREMTVDGGLTLEADIKYSGGFKVVIAAVARIELGARFKPRTVSLVLATILKRLEGHLLIRIKPPPSNRIWISFESMPKLDVSVEPVVSSRQITYGIILRAIESRIREVIGETIVYPNWDDVPFFDTEPQPLRGGIWQRKLAPVKSVDQDSVVDEELSIESTDEALLTDINPASTAPSDVKLKRHSMPQAPSTRISSYSSSITSTKDDHISTLADSASSSQTSLSTPPKMMRSNSFATAATPVVTKDDQFTGDTNRNHSRGAQQDATSAMKELSTRPYDNASTTSVVAQSSRSYASKSSSLAAGGAAELLDQHDIGGIVIPNFQGERMEVPRASAESQRSSRLGATLADATTEPSTARWGQSLTAKPGAVDRKAVINQSIGSATAAARKWGMGVLNRQAEWKRQASIPVAKDSPRQPYGRGQPLPPPGTPLPRPEPNSWSATALNSLKRKPVAGTSNQSAQELSYPTEPEAGQSKTQKTPSISSTDSNGPANAEDLGVADADHVDVDGHVSSSSKTGDEVESDQLDMPTISTLIGSESNHQAEQIANASSGLRQPPTP